MQVRTHKGKWVVTASWYGKTRVVFTPDPRAHALQQIRACIDFKEANA